MRFDIVTIFPEFFAGPLDYGIVRRAREAGIVDVRVHDLRNFTHDRHRTVDDRPFGGGEGMLLKPEPLFEAVESLLGHSVGDSESSRPLDSGAAVVLLSASGKRFVQDQARRFAALDRVIMLCGRYEGVDERVADYLATDDVSVGDFVLSGGELPAALVLDAVTRLLPGALGNEASSENESFSSSAQPANNSSVTKPMNVPGDSGCEILLDCPHYTRPADFRGWRVPEVLISGHHEEIRRWRHEAALTKTRRNRPDLVYGK